MGSSLNEGPVWYPFYLGAVLSWGPQKMDPNLENCPFQGVKDQSFRELRGFFRVSAYGFWKGLAGLLFGSRAKAGCYASRMLGFVGGLSGRL